MNKILSVIAVLCLVFSASPIFAAEGPVGYGGAKIQMLPMMAPYRTPSGVQYQVLTIRLLLAPGDNERAACFMVPILHEKFLMYMHDAKLTQTDFAGQRLEVLAAKLLEIAAANTDRGYFTGVEFLDDQSLPPAPAAVKNAAPLDQRSQTLSSQCR